MITTYAEALATAQEALELMDDLRTFLGERAALSGRTEAVRAWERVKAVQYDLKDVEFYLDFLKRS